MAYTPGIAVINGVKYRPYIGGVKHTFPYYKEQDEHTLLLLHGDSLEDSSMYQVPITNNGVVVSTDQSKFSGSSLYFNGSSYLEFLSSVVDFGSGDFTYDWWEYLVTTGGTTFCSQRAGSTGMQFRYCTIYLYANSNYQSPQWDIINKVDAFDSTVKQWIHWAVVRNGTLLTVYKNGTQTYQKDIGTVNFVINPNIKAAIGTNAGAVEFRKGYIDEFRISNVARWTFNFTPPTEPYSS